MEWGAIIAEIITFIVTFLLVYAWRVYVRPYLEDKHLMEIAAAVVHAAEAKFGAGHGEEKLTYALQLINEKYQLSIDSEKILMAVEAAWKAMDILQKN